MHDQVQDARRRRASTTTPSRIAITNEADVARAARRPDSRQEIDRATATLEADADDARGGFGMLTLAIPLLFVLAGALVLLGLQRRISEYR